MDEPGTPPTGGQPSGPTDAQLAAAAAARQAVAYRLLGAACALVGVLLVGGGLLALRGHSAAPPPAAPVASPPDRTATTMPPSGTTAPATVSPTTTVPRTTVPPSTVPPTTTSHAPAATGNPTRVPVRAPLTVLNNTIRAHLAERAAALFHAGGWQVVKVGNFTGIIPSTTVYFTPGSSTEERAAQALAGQFPGIARVLPRYSGLPPSVQGVIVVLAPDWPG